MRIKKCKDCGEKAEVPRECYDDESARYVWCTGCGKESRSHWNGHSAIKEWNHYN